MRIVNFVAVLLVAMFASLGAASAQGPAAASNAIDFSGVDFGESHPFAKVHTHVEGLNVAGRELEIDRVVASQAGIASVDFKPVSVPAGASFSMDIEVSLNGDVGGVSHHFDVYAKGQSEPVDGFSVHGFVDWLVSPEGTDIQFGVVELSKPVHRVIPIEVRPGASVKLLEIENSSDYFSAKVVEDGKALELKSKADAPWSTFDETLLVKTDNALQPKVAFRLRGQMRGAVVPSSDPLDFGVLREGQGAELALVLNDASGKPLKIGKVVANSRATIETRIEDCVPGDPSCQLLKVTYPPMQLRGVTGGVLEIELPSYKRKLYVRFGALGIGKNTKIMDLAEELNKAGKAEPSVSSALQQAMKQLVSPLEMSRPEGNGPLLTWKAAHENGVYGYEVYRADSQRGPFQRVSSGIIPRLDKSGELGSIYRWRDGNAKSGNSYWYYVNLVMQNGDKRSFTSPQKVLAK